MMALLVGTALALVALAFVLYPLFSGTHGPERAAAAPSAGSEPTPAERAVAALREVEFDRETGKLSESDYAALKSTYTREALTAMRAAAPAATTVSDDEVEAVILTYRARNGACPTCGPRPESDAVYCSTCGVYLAGECGQCGAAVTEPAARFCTKCGAGLAA